MLQYTSNASENQLSIYNLNLLSIHSLTKYLIALSNASENQAENPERK
jgi:hypothetical protein